VVLKGAVDQLLAAEFELNRVRSIAGEKSDMVLLAEGKVEELKGDIRESIRNIRIDFQTQKKSIENNIARSSGLYASIPEKEKGFIEISRQQAIKNEIYTYLLKKREETALSSASTSADLRVLERGFSYGPIKPIPKNYYWTGLLIGLLAFLIYVQAFEQFNNKIMFRSEIENRTSVPVIGEIFLSTYAHAIRAGSQHRSCVEPLSDAWGAGTVERGQHIPERYENLHARGRDFSCTSG
jgi:hypothetical protein